MMAVLASAAVGLVPAAAADEVLSAASEAAPPPGAVVHSPENLAAANRMSSGVADGGDSGGAAMVNDLSSCPGHAVITADLTLTDDLTCHLEVQGSGITIDLNGHTLFGRIHQYSSGGPIIKNGTIDAASVPNFVGAVFVSGALIDDVTVRNGSAWTMIIGSGTTVQSSRFIDNSSVVFDLYWGGGNTIRKSYFARNGSPISIQLDSGNLIQENVFVDNAVGVNMWNELGGGVSNNVVSKNVFWGNDTGIRLLGRGRFVPFGPNLENNQFRENIFVGNRGAGMVATPDCSPPSGPCPGANTVVERNLFAANGRDPLAVNVDDGLHIVPDGNWSGFFTVRKNITLFNADLGIEAPGVTDGGKNHGLFNGDRRQCVGVRCRFGLFG